MKSAPPVGRNAGPEVRARSCALTGGKPETKMQKPNRKDKTMNEYQVTISGALGREIANQHPAQNTDGARGRGIRKAIAALAGVDEPAVELVSGGGQWHVNLSDAEARDAFHAALDRVKEAAKR